MHLLHAVLSKRIHITKRDLFYTDVKLFVDQTDSDAVLDDVATMIGCTRSNLHVVASDKGLVVGRIQFEEDGDPIDCTRMGVGGKAIPPYVDKIENIRMLSLSFWWKRKPRTCVLRYVFEHRLITRNAAYCCSLQSFDLFL